MGNLWVHLAVCLLAEGGGRLQPSHPLRSGPAASLQAAAGREPAGRPGSTFFSGCPGPRSRSAREAREAALGVDAGGPTHRAAQPWGFRRPSVRAWPFPSEVGVTALVIGWESGNGCPPLSVHLPGACLLVEQCGSPLVQCGRPAGYSGHSRAHCLGREAVVLGRGHPASPPQALPSSGQ